MVGLVDECGYVVLAPDEAHGPLARYERLWIRCGDSAPVSFLNPPILNRNGTDLD